ncbi:MAG TPA: hypothetical protein VK993_05635, partial [Chthoniobacterales bacterium]|nr:hypothetical protein [Chthoniobacterales bacterium]
MAQSSQLTPERWQRVKTVVSDALDCPTTTRDAFIAAACADDTVVYREVESMLAFSASKLDACVEELAGARGSRAEPVAGERIGAYELVREIGRGGMGAVYLARRADAEYQKEVAIKLLKRGTDTDEVLRRFRAEREILACL